MTQATLQWLFAFHGHTLPYTVRIFPSSNTLLDRTTHVLPSFSPHSSAFRRRRPVPARLSPRFRPPARYPRAKPRFRSVSRYRTFAVRFYSPQFRCRIPCNKPHPFLLRQVNTAVRHDQSLFCRERPAQMVQVNAQVGFLVDQHAAGGVHRRPSKYLSDLTGQPSMDWYTCKVICFISMYFLRIMSASHPKEQRELTLFRSKGTGITR